MIEHFDEDFDNDMEECNMDVDVFLECNSDCLGCKYLNL